jgi:hypothetical protein
VTLEDALKLAAENEPGPGQKASVAQDREVDHAPALGPPGAGSRQRDHDESESLHSLIVRQ